MRKLRIWLKQLLPSLISIAIGLLFGWYLLFITRPMDSFAGLGMILAGCFADGAKGVGNLLYTAAPIILTGLSVGFSMRTGLFNIGAAGQFTCGAFAAIFVGVKLTFLPPGLHCIAAILAGTLAGALCGCVPGALKALFRVSEVISGILLNYISMLLTDLLIRENIYDSVNNCTMRVAESARISGSFLDGIFPGSRINAGFPVVLAVLLIVWILMEKTVLGYELKITGKNRFAGLYSGIRDTRNIALSMTICGAIAGIGGALMYLSDFGDRIVLTETILPQGFTGISVALLGMSSPFGILAAGLFIAHLTIGGHYLQLYSYTPDVIDMIVAIIVYCGALTLPIRQLMERLALRRKTARGSALTKEGGAA